jgi:hypothetical protein
MIQKAIAKLSPSAARLLLAYMTCKRDDDLDKVILRSGIGTYKTFVKAKQELLSHGILQYQGDSLFLIKEDVKL